MRTPLKRIQTLKDALFQRYLESLTPLELAEGYLKLEARRREAFDLPPITEEEWNRTMESAARINAP